MTTGRYLYGQLSLEEDEFEIQDEEVHHIRNVIRKTSGDRIELMDGSGNIAGAKITRIDRKRIRVRIVSRKVIPKPFPRIILVFGIPKKESTISLIIKSSTELGVTVLHPLVTQHSRNIQPAAEKIRRWKKIIENTCKQCGQAWFPEIRIPEKIEDIMKDKTGADNLNIVGWEPSLGDPHIRKPLPETMHPQITWIVGPEGGWSKLEAEYLLSIPCHALRLGSLTLTTPVACIAGLVSIKTHFRLF